MLAHHRSATPLALVVAVLTASVLAATPVGAVTRDVERVAGPDRVTTAIAVASRGWDRAGTVVLARADDPADALSGSALAGALGAPLLITPSDRLDVDVAAELRRLGTRRAYLLGGPAALAGRVERALDRAGVETTRLAGADRYATAAAIARRLDVAPQGTALLVGGWPDALGVSGLAATRAAAGDPWPVLVTGRTLPDATWDALQRLQVARVVIVGGPAAVSPAVEAALARRGYATERLAGPTRYATSAAVAHAAAGDGTLVAATGTRFADGLAAGPLAARLGGTLVLVPPAVTAGVEAAWFDLAAAHDQAVVVGGDAAVPASVGERLSDIVTGEQRRHVVAVAPTDDLQELIDRNPAGIHYRLASGIHRLVEVRPRDGDAFTGAVDTVLSGAVDISSGEVTWRRTGSAWYVEGQRQQRLPSGDIEAGGNPRDRRPEELFVDDVRFLHVGSVAELGDGRWYFDYAADRIWIGEDPADLGRIETSVAEHAFEGPEVRDVRIRNVTIEKYANRTSRGAINGNRTTNWVVRNCTVRWNHGAGIGIGPGMHVSGCDVHDNGQIGLAGSCTYRSGPREGVAIPATVTRNRIHDNGVLTFRWQWESGALKLARCGNGLRFENNWVADNDGPGPWFDGHNRDVVVRDNLVEGNSQRGILYEISSAGQIFHNTVRHNAIGVEPYTEGAGIYISNSDATAVFGNLVEGSPSGIIARSASDREPHVRGLSVEDNDVSYTHGRTGLNVDRGEPFDAYTSWGNRFRGNTYRLPSLDGRWFLWADDRAKTAEAWRSYGQDVDGRFLTGASGGTLPAHAIGFRLVRYGPR